jgi:hypothetical protein
VGKRGSRDGKRNEQHDKRGIDASHCWPGTVGRMFFW